ncbi:MAG: hypothetical protein LBT22_04410 [Peptococcaceae bacterium]|jgi:hypothetical protein|nr:hypothetical protein [Peptococcaceae bacterium]
MTKKFIGTGLSLLLLLSLVGLAGAAAVFAAASGQLVVSSVSGAVGDEVEVAVSIANNPGIATFNVKLNYDKSQLEPLSLAQGGALTAGGITSNLQIPGVDAAQLDHVTALWYNLSNITANGVLFTVKFKIKPGASGTIPLTLSYNADDVSDQNYANVSVTAQAGAVEVTAGDPNSDPDPDPGQDPDQDPDPDLNPDPGAPVMAVSASAPDANGEFNAVVSIANNPGIATFTVRLNYDKSKITPVSLTQGAALTVGNITSNMQIPDVDVSRFDYVTAMWYNPSNITANGIVFTVKFKVKDGVSGETALGISYGAGDISDQMGVDVDFVCQGTTAQLEASAYVVVISEKGLRKQDGAITGEVEFNVINNSGSTRSAAVFIAVYDAAGKMVYTKVKADIPLARGDNAVRFTDISIANASSRLYTAKVFCWSSVNQMEPLAYPAILDF